MKFYQSPTIVIGLLLFLALVFGTFYRINSAIKTHPGLVSVDAYNLGEQYGEIQKNTQKLITQGYSLKLKKHNFIELKKQHNYEIKLTKHNKIIKNAQIKVYFYRPLEKKYDFEKQARFDGKNYIVSTALSRKGKWRLVIEAKFDNNILDIFAKVYVNDNLIK